MFVPSEYSYAEAPVNTEEPHDTWTSSPGRWLGWGALGVGALTLAYVWKANTPRRSNPSDAAKVLSKAQEVHTQAQEPGFMDNLYYGTIGYQIESGKTGYETARNVYHAKGASGKAGAYGEGVKKQARIMGKAGSAQIKTIPSVLRIFGIPL